MAFTSWDIKQDVYSNYLCNSVLYGDTQSNLASLPSYFLHNHKYQNIFLNIFSKKRDSKLK